MIRDGRIQIDGTYETIKENDPQLAEGWSSVIRQISEVSEAESEDENATLSERKHLFRQVSLQKEEEEKLERAKLIASGSVGEFRVEWCIKVEWCINRFSKCPWKS